MTDRAAVLSPLRRRARRATPTPDLPSGEIDLTPMIDVTFQLIVFLLVANDLSRKDLAELDLPVAVSAVEDGPSADDLRVVVNVERPAAPDAPPSYVQAGRRLSARELLGALQVAADRSREGAAGTPSRVRALVRADRDAPWSHVQAVLQACADPRVRIWKLDLAARRDPDAAVGVADAAGGAR